MSEMHWKIGQSIPCDGQRKVLGAPCDPVWYVLICAPGRDEAARRWLLRRGFAEAWFPVREVWRKLPQHRKARPVPVRVAPGYVFVLTDRAIQWDVLWDQSCGRLRAVIGTMDGPMPIAPKAIAEMRQVPKLLDDLHRQAEEARRVVVGCRARIAAGPFEGHVVAVTELEDGMAPVLITLFGRTLQIEASIDSLERLPDVGHGGMGQRNSG